MKLTKVVKLALNSVPGYKRWAFNRAISSLQTGKQRLLDRAQTRLVFNEQTQQLEPSYSRSVQAVLTYYNREIDRQRQAFYANTMPELQADTAGASRA